VLLQRRGFEMSVTAYHRQDFFLPLLREAGVRYRCLEERGRVRRLLAFRRLLRGGSQDVVVAFLGNPALLAEFAALPRRRWGLVVSERTSYLGTSRGYFRWRAGLHRLADYVTTNSHTNRLVLERNAPWLSGRVATIYNHVDLQEFSPLPEARDRATGPLRLLVVGRFSGEKNALRLVDAVARARDLAPATDLHVDWYGDSAADSTSGHARSALHATVAERIERAGLQARFRLHPPTLSIVDRYREASALLLASLFEGLPNVVCEAMACGRPVLLSDVCDHANLVAEGDNGFLFDPLSPDDIARAIASFCARTPGERERMGRRSRERAERMFGPGPVVSAYVELIEAAARRQRIALSHWVPTVPPSARRDARKPLGSFRAGVPGVRA
jgi:glycosyltransferase involved in cell wall biosynthesis